MASRILRLIRFRSTALGAIAFGTVKPIRGLPATAPRGGLPSAPTSGRSAAKYPIPLLNCLRDTAYTRW
jgi:hypothetical protein